MPLIEQFSHQIYSTLLAAVAIKNTSGSAFRVFRQSTHLAVTVLDVA